MPDRVEDLIRAAAKTHGVPEALALAVAEQESGFNPTLINKDSGAIGTFQILPTTGAMLKIDPLDPRQNIDGGVKYLRQLLDRHQGDLSKVLGTYGGVVHDTEYVPGVLARVSKYKGAATTAVGAPPGGVSGTTAAAADLSDVGTGGAPLRARGTAGVLEQATQAAQRIGPGRSAAADAIKRVYEGGKTIAGTVASSFDPTTPSGLVNIAATVPAIAATALTGGVAAAAAPEITLATRALMVGGSVARQGLRPWLARTLAPPAAAAAGGVAGQVYNQTRQGRNLDLGEAMTTGAEQGAYEIGGQILIWPIRKIGSVIAAHPVAKAAIRGLEDTAIGVREAGIAGVQAVQRAGRARIDALKEAQTLARAGKKAALQDSAAVVASGAKAAVQTAKARVPTAATLPGTRGLPLADLELETAAEIAEATNTLKDLQRLVPSSTDTAAAVRKTVIGRPGVMRMADDEIEGAAAGALRQAGERVAAAATHDDAPPVAMAAIRDQAARLATIYPPTGLMGGARAEGVSELIPTEEATPALSSFAQWIAQRNAMKEMVDAGAPAERTLPGILGLIQHAPDEISFEDAHIVKTMLDSAVNWDVSQKPIWKNVTKALRGTLRESMTGFEPYDEATRAYQGLVPLFNKGATKRLIDAVGKNATPDKAERILNAADPISAARVRRLLVDTTREGGDAAQGQAAWDAVRSAWTHRRIIQGPPEKLAERVARLQETPEFAAVVFGDPAGQQILGNLTALGQAIARGQAKAAELRAAAGAIGTQGVEDTTRVLDNALKAIGRMNDREFAAFKQQQARVLRQAEESVIAAAQGAQQRSRFAADAMKREMEAFAGSSLGKAKGTTFELSNATDALTAVMRLKTHWGTLAMVRLLMGPKRADLLQYAAYASPRTQAAVRLLSTPMSDRIAADTIRSFAQQAYGAPPAATLPAAASPTPTPEPRP